MGVLSRRSVQTLVRRIVKPSSPTPPSLSCYKLSRMDQIMPSNYLPISFFFPAIDNGKFTGKDHLFSHAERSLAKALSHYYPLAGRLVRNDSVNCNDAGVELIRAQMNCSLAEILDNINSPDVEDLVLPEGVPWTIADSTNSLLVAQVTHFDCKGFAISLCMSHKIADGFGFISFMNDWAAIARKTNHVPSPALIGASVFPPADKLLPSAPLVISSNRVSRRFIFTASEISKLKVMAIQLGVEQPTRVEVVTALLFRCAILGSGSFRPSVLAQALNLRSLVSSVSQVPENLFGNFSFQNGVYGTNENNIRFEEIVAQIRKVKAERGICFEVLKSDEQIQEFHQMMAGKHRGPILDFFISTPLCRFPYYHVDFGWGRPIRVLFRAVPMKNTFTLLDTPDEQGIEATVTLDKSDMERFECNKELLSFVAKPQTK